MKPSTDTFLGRFLLAGVCVILVLLPFHAFLSVWVADFTGHYTLVRLWKEGLLGLLGVAALIVVFRNKSVRTTLGSKDMKIIGLLIVTYIALHGVIGLWAFVTDAVTPKALGYSLISNLRFLMFFAICGVVAIKYGDFFQKHWQKLLLIPAGIVVAFGLLQFLLLPVDFLKHFGYNSSTIAPYIAVDQKIEYARVQSFLRGPNPLGAYLVLVVTALSAVVWAKKKKLYSLPILMSLIVLFGTYSRSAWIGLVAAIALLAAYYVPKNVRKTVIIVAVAVGIVAGGAVVALRDHDTVQNILFHTDETSASATSSNENRAGAITGGMKDMVREPLGQGPGTAGPASVYADETRIAENYFIQIGQEVGVLGLGLFIAINGYIGILLWRIRAQNRLAVILLASGIGLALVNLLSHAWADDTLAYLWWGFAGIAVAGGFTTSKYAREPKIVNRSRSMPKV